MYTSYTRFQMAFISIVAALLVGCAAQQTISEAPEQRSAYVDELIPTPAPPLPEAAATTASQQTARSSERLGTQWGEGVSSNVVTVNLHRISNQPIDIKEIHYSATNYRGQAVQEAMLANGRIGFSVLNEHNQRWALTQDGQRLYLKGRQGERYQLQYHNYSQNTHEIVATVDGLNVLNGSPGSFSNRGYVLYPNATIIIEGFRKSQSGVVAFRFSAPRDAYASNTDAGSPQNIGVIGTAIFELNTPNHCPLTSRNNPPRTPQAFPGDRSGGSYAPPPNYSR